LREEYDPAGPGGENRFSQKSTPPGKREVSIQPAFIIGGERAKQGGRGKRNTWSPQDAEDMAEGGEKKKEDGSTHLLPIEP